MSLHNVWNMTHDLTSVVVLTSEVGDAEGELLGEEVIGIARARISFKA